MSDATGQLDTECPACEGWGETQESAREMARDPATGLWQTLIMGYGCLRCGGTGQLESKHE